MSDYSLLSQAIIEGKGDQTAGLATNEINSGAKPQDIISQVLQPAMSTVGEKFSSGEFFLPDMLLAARAMNNALAVLKPLLADTGMPTLGKVIIGTVKGDIHDIGKNIVATFLRGVGFEVIDLGEDVPDEKFIEAVKENKADILGLCALLTTTMPSLNTVIKALEAAGLRSSIKVIVGGAPVTRDFATHIGADAYAHDGGEAARVCKELMTAKGAG
jgi:5-methyltetrahydrofolate--homocysteine methyltransferase